MLIINKFIRIRKVSTFIDGISLYTMYKSNNGYLKKISAIDILSLYTHKNTYSLIKNNLYVQIKTKN